MQYFEDLKIFLKITISQLNNTEALKLKGFDIQQLITNTDTILSEDASCYIEAIPIKTLLVLRHVKSVKEN